MRAVCVRLRRAGFLQPEQRQRHPHHPPPCLDRALRQARQIARWTLPLWFYVNVTGVIVYFMVYQIYAP